MRKIVGGIFDGQAADPHALYVAQLTPGSHPAPRVQMAFCIGNWSPTGRKEERRVVGMEIWRDADRFVTGLIDARDSLLGGMDMGIEFSADEVRGSSWRFEVFELSDALLRKHAFLREHLMGVAQD